MKDILLKLISCLNPCNLKAWVRAYKSSVAVNNLYQLIEKQPNSIKKRQTLALFNKYRKNWHLIELLHAQNINDIQSEASKILTEHFLIELAKLEFCYNGCIFAGGSHRNITQHIKSEAMQFGQLLGKKLKHIILATGATTEFMEIINCGYNLTGNASITATAEFPIIGNKVNKEIRYCLTALDFIDMEKLLISEKTIAGVFFPGGLGTAYELISFMILRQNKAIPQEAPIVLITDNNKESYFYDLLSEMQKLGKVYDSDLEDIHIVNTAQEAIEVLLSEKYKHLFQKEEQCEYSFIRKLYVVNKERYL